MVVKTKTRTTAVAARPSSAVAPEFTDEQVALLSRTIVPGATKDELALFIGACKRTNLDPFTRQIFGVKMSGKLNVIVSIDGFRLIAARSGKYAGQTKAEWCGQDGQWKDVWLEATPPAAARVGVHHKDFNEALYGVALMRSYKGTSPLWTKMPEVMLAKVAESIALRKAFPNDLGGLYAPEEFDQAKSNTPAIDALDVEVVHEDIPDADAPYFAGDAKQDTKVNVDDAFHPLSPRERLQNASTAYGMGPTELERMVGKQVEMMSQNEMTRIADRLEALKAQGKRYLAPVAGAEPVSA